MSAVAQPIGQWDVITNLPTKDKAKSKVDPDEAIDAYLKGKADGFKQGKKDFHTKVTKSINAGMKGAHKCTTEVLEYFKAIGVKPSSARLRIVSPFVYEVVFIVSSKVYNSPVMEQVYNHVLKKQEAVKSKDFCMDFYVTHGTSKTMIDEMRHDGFDLAYIAV